MMYNCPNCSAPITGDRCEYCGTVFRRKREPPNIWLETLDIIDLSKPLETLCTSTSFMSSVWAGDGIVVEARGME